jgi:hypothetical protein
MDGAARITSIDALSEFRAALIKFKSEAAAALIETESELQRTLLWLRHDQTAYWQRQARARQELLTRAKTDLYRKQVAQDREVRIGVDQKKAVEKAKRDLAQAEEKIEAVRRWIRTLDKEMVLYRGECQGLAAMIEGGVPEIVKRMDGMMDALRAYLMVSGTGGAAAERETESLADATNPGATHEHHGGPHTAPGRGEGPADPLGADQGAVERRAEPPG